MNDMGFLGLVAMDSSILLPVLCRNSSDVLTAPDADPTYTVFAKDQTSVQTGTMTGNPGSVTGFQAALESITAARGYTSGETYTVLVEYDISAAAHGAVATFSVQ